MIIRRSEACNFCQSFWSLYRNNIDAKYSLLSPIMGTYVSPNVSMVGFASVYNFRIRASIY